MNRLIVAFCLLLFSVPGNGQNYRKVDRFVYQLPNDSIKNIDTLGVMIGSNFSREAERLRAIYGWICSNIEYDIERMANPVSYSSDSAVQVTLGKRKAICSGYVDLFIHLCRSLDIKAYYISGYTKQNGKVVDQDHAWAAVRLSNGQWKLFDPTWGASEWVNGELVKRLNYDYFMVEPAEFINSHMPFDPMWQLLYQPIKTDEFYGQKVKRDVNFLLNYNDAIRDAEALSESRMYEEMISRMEWAGVRNSSTRRYYDKAKQGRELALAYELQLQKEAWWYDFSQQEKNYQTSIEMYEQIKGLKNDYKQRGVTPQQLKYSSGILVNHTDECLRSIDKLMAEKMADVAAAAELRSKVLILKGLIANQNNEVLKIVQ